MHGCNCEYPLKRERLLENHMKLIAVRFVTLGIVLMLGVSPALAQDAPDGFTADQSQSQAIDQGQAQDQAATPADDTNPPASPPAPADPAAVIAQWGPAPAIGPDADNAVAQRWFRAQNAERARWGVPTAARDPYLDWMAENLLRDRLGQQQLPQPEGLIKPAAIAQSPKSDQGVLSETEFWTVSDDLWQAWLDSIQGHPSQFWEEDHPGEQWFTVDRYIRLFKLQQMPRFDRYRLIGSAGRVDTSETPPTVLLSGEADELEALAPGVIAAYAPVSYTDNVVAVVGYDPWINPDGSIRP
jgi:hypothetical protein